MATGPIVNGITGLDSDILKSTMEAMNLAWNPRPTVFITADLPAALNVLAGLVEIVTDVVRAPRLVAAEDISFPWRLPEDLDRSKAINVRVVWSKPDTATTNVTFVGTYRGFAVDTAFAAAATAFDTVIGAQAGLATANVVRNGNWGVINGNAFASTDVWGAFMIDATTLGAGITNVDIYGIEVRYYRRFI